ncbi:MAG: metallophosphoesterase [Myxococcota bacterium]|nr:metallophosphoesterase [Myxococcota bacterium]
MIRATVLMPMMMLVRCAPEHVSLPPGTEEASSADGVEAPDEMGDTAVADTGGGTSVLVNGGFERQLEGWSLDAGDCQLSQGRLEIEPFEGSWFLWGGIGQAGSCRASQMVELASMWSLAEIDAGTVAAELEAVVATRGLAGDYDDQPRLRVSWSDAHGAPLGSLETLVGGGSTWHVRGATGMVPAGARRAHVVADARLRRLPDNDAMLDAVTLRLRHVEGVAPGITRQPMLQDHRTDAMRVLWETDGNLADHAVVFGPADGELESKTRSVRTIEVDATHHVHIADMEGLQPDTIYAYRVQSGATEGTVHEFRTAPGPRAATRIAWMADNQEGADRFATHVRHLSARAPDLLVVAGDIVADMDALSQWRDDWWAPLEERGFASTVPVLVARGNHDRHHPYAYAYTALPGNEDFYSFRYGSVFVIVLDTQQPMSNQPHPLDQAGFIQEALAGADATSADFRVAVFHQAPYTNIRQDSSDGNAGVRSVWMEPLKAGGVDLVIGGHYHSYQRGELDGVTHVVVGGGGSTLLSGPEEELWTHMTLLERAWHYSVMDVVDGQLSWVTYDIDDQVLDRFTRVGGPLE